MFFSTDDGSAVDAIRNKCALISEDHSPHLMTDPAGSAFSHPGYPVAHTSDDSQLFHRRPHFIDTNEFRGLESFALSASPSRHAISPSARMASALLDEIPGALQSSKLTCGRVPSLHLSRLAAEPIQRRLREGDFSEGLPDLLSCQCKAPPGPEGNTTASVNTSILRAWRPLTSDQRLSLALSRRFRNSLRALLHLHGRIITNPEGASVHLYAYIRNKDVACRS
ncbi:hypothetical protein EVG20_g3528 [Dentipellis fragilis]|uniref:Uncharacterized protein n=1 Tax=Dentipellis fragilis TaxID=205917 RepID=A0A4Y9Z3L4_9AGAM|nr:hypothetical protein EVG20_g3528 [Dentipellis fragilis]